MAVGVTTGSGLLVDWLWFDMLGFGGVFATTWGTKLIVFGVAAVLSAALLALNGVLAARTQPPPQPRRLRLMRGNGVEGLPDILELSPENLPWRLIVVALAVVLGLFIGVAQAGNWETFLNWLYGVPFGRTDPLFGKDLGFYVFVLPAYGIVRDWGILMVFLAVVHGRRRVLGARRHRRRIGNSTREPGGGAAPLRAARCLLHRQSRAITSSSATICC